MTKIYGFIVAIAVVMAISGCSTRGSKVYRNHSNSGYSNSNQQPTKHLNSDTMDRKTYSHPTMRPYVIRGIKYYPTVVTKGDIFRGNASWYGPNFHGKLTSNGETYNMHEMTAAHKTLPMNTIVKVTNLRNNLTTTVRINDRGPFIATRIIDLSNLAAKEIKMLGAGTAPVTIEILGFHSKNRRNMPTKKELNLLPATSSTGIFSLQIASFSKIEGAISTQAKYDGTSGYKTIIKDIQKENSRIFKVLLTGFKSEQEARDYKVNSEFSGSFIVRED